MHYYQFNIGDYKSHTEHLSEMEDLTYRRLLDWYYLHETPIPLDITETARQIRMRSHSDCISIVLQEYFERTADGWIHHRANSEILKAGDKSQKASESAKARWNKEKNANALPAQSEGNATHNTRHKTQNTKPKDKVADAPVVLPDWMPLETWAAYLSMRKKIKKPATDYAMKLLVDKLAKFKANGQDVQKVLEKSITAGWQDVFEIHDKQPFTNKFDVAHTTTPPPPNQDAALKKIAEDRKKAVPMPADIKAKMAELTKGMKV